jgi:prepilin-type N-terminal cleavage/methylation domain-containing protein
MDRVYLCRGFTLIEILTVIAIITILLSAFVVVGRGYSDRARAHKTQGILERVEVALEAYRCEFGDYPPDGYDYSVTTSDGYPLRGSASLTYFLAWKKSDGINDPQEFILMKRLYTPDYAEDPQHRSMVEAHNRQPYLEIEDKLITRAGEIADGWGNPIHYDNLAYDQKTHMPRYSPNPRGMHNCPDPDPRQVRRPQGPFQPGTFDLWSNGKDGHKRGAKADDDIIRGERAK